MKVERNRGSLTLEMVLSLLIALLVLGGFISVISAGVRFYNKVDNQDEEFFSSDYLLTYIENEINKVDEIFLVNNEDYKIIFFRESKGSNGRYLYYSFILTRDGKVSRLAYNSNMKLGNEEIKWVNLQGYNTLCTDVNEFDINYAENHIDVSLNIGMNKPGKDLYKRIFINSKVTDLRDKYEKH